MKPLRRRPLALLIPALLATPALLLTTAALADGRLEGQVSDRSGVHLAGAEVRLSNGLSRTTGSDGRFDFGLLPAGSYTLTVRYLGATEQQQQVELADDQRFNAELVLTSDSRVEHILVVGQAGATSAALNQQKNADNIATIAASDAIGQFADNTAGESLQRLAGISIERDQGEGRYVRVRGLAPDLNAVSYSGTRLPAPEADRRAVSLDSIPSDLLESLTVTKTLTPDMDGDSLGGAVEIKSLSAFDRDGEYYNLSAEGSYNQLDESYSPKLAATWSDTFDVGDNVEALGVAIATSWYERDFATDNAETGGDWDLDDNRLEGFENRDYQITRERLGLAANIDYRPSDDNQWFLRTLYSRYRDDEVRNALVTSFEDGQQSGDNGAADVARELKAREEEQQIGAIILGGEQRFDRWQLNWQGGYSEAREQTPFSIAGGVFEQAFDDGIGYRDNRKPVVFGPEALYLADGYELDEVEMSDSKAHDQETHAKIDLLRELDLGGQDAQIKFGAKSSRRSKEAREDIWVYEDFGDYGIDDDALSLSGYQSGAVDYGFGRFGPGISDGALLSLVNSLPREEFIDEVESAINDYDIDEDIDAGYLMGRTEFGSWRLVGGARYEHTSTRSQGSAYDAVSDSFTSRNSDRSYGNWLPSAHLRYAFSDKLIGRAAWSNTLVRPSFAQIAPGMLLDEDDGDLEAAFGNPELEPITAANYDLGIEYYGGGIGVMSAMVFYKQIDDFIYATDLAGSGAWADYKHAETYANGDDAKVSGLELSYVKSFSELPAPFDGLLLSANATFTDSEATIDWYDEGERMSRGISLPSQSDRSANLAIGYETERLSLRLSAAYQSGYLLEIGELDDARYDVHEDDHLQYDLIGKWFVSEEVQLYMKGLNLSDEPYYSYVGDSGHNAQYESYGRTFMVGVQVTNF